MCPVLCGTGLPPRIDITKGTAVTCEALIDKFLLDYHAGALPLGRKIDFEVHLALCPDCRKYVAAYKQTINLAQAAETESLGDPPPELIESILKLSRQQ